MLSGERDDPAGAFNPEARKVLVGEFRRADPALRVHHDAVSQDSRALDDRVAGNLARNPFNIGAEEHTSISAEALMVVARVRVSATIA